jgi:hypothetical protein
MLCASFAQAKTALSRRSSDKAARRLEMGRPAMMSGSSPRHLLLRFFPLAHAKIPS